ncbi:MAG TPA: PmoA family protein [Sedimentisphaerales bacterium]|nr:PmoA family protein [Sedimentisphaerales bacterium]HRS09926.1 PmoA family protein [Sedimentisphaerales bacterium]HRV46424.1 PmoA family protein [Sedimentisphaerales bacterium]
MRRGYIPSAIGIVLIVVSMEASGVRGAPLWRATVDANSLWVRAGESPVLQYRYGDVPFKPYVKELYTPNGLNVLLDAPHDHLHHHALMFAVAVDGVNCWEETPTAGHQRHDAFIERELGSGPRSWARFGERIHWVDAAGRRLLDEQRTVNVRHAGEPKAVLLTWQSQLSVPEGKASVTLSGSHYFGLGLRFIRAMDVHGQFRNADGRPGVVFRGEERLTDSDWCAYTSKAGDTVVTIAMFGHPDNPRHPTTWFTMATPFAYLSATMRLHEKPLVVPSGEPLMLRYGVAVWDGQIEVPRIEAMYQEWVSQESVLSD